MLAKACPIRLQRVLQLRKRFRRRRPVSHTAGKVRKLRPKAAAFRAAQFPKPHWVLSFVHWHIKRTAHHSLGNHVCRVLANFWNALSVHFAMSTSLAMSENSDAERLVLAARSRASNASLGLAGLIWPGARKPACIKRDFASCAVARPAALRALTPPSHIQDSSSGTSTMAAHRSPQPLALRSSSVERSICSADRLSSPQPSLSKITSVRLCVRRNALRNSAQRNRTPASCLG